MFIKDKTYKLIILGLGVLFIVVLFFSIRFLKNQISQSISPSLQSDEIPGTLDWESWNKIKHRFQ